MTKYYLILLLSSLICMNGWTQASMEQEETGTKVNSSTAKSDSTFLDVLFATNEDCDLYINGQFNCALKKSTHKYIKLAPGTYAFTAKERFITEPYENKFIVKSGKANEVFIDLLYFIDQTNKKKSSSQQLTIVGSVNASKKAGADQPEEDNAPSKELLEMQVVQALSSNMVSINGGSFIMGNNQAPASDEVEHTVTIGPVLFGKYEVTQEQWGIIMGYNPSENKGCGSCPVENVTWEEVMKFIQKLNVLSNRRFRLPTEAEWEFVARTGEIELADGRETYIGKTAWYNGNANKKPHPIGLKQPNILGIYDLYGNVSEWCYDWYSAEYFKEENNQTDPDGPPAGIEKVFRGGSFAANSGDQLRPSLRNKAKPTTKSKSLGFRLVMDIQ